MRVIERGGPRAVEWQQEIKCSGCLAKLGIDGNDLRHSTELLVGSYRDQECPTFFVWCPVCNTKLWVYHVPKTVEIEVINLSRPTYGGCEKD